MIGAGNEFHTPVITKPTQLFAFTLSAKPAIALGLSAADTIYQPGAFRTSVNLHTLAIKVTRHYVLDSVTLIAESAGKAEISLLDTNKFEVSNVSIRVNQGINRVPVGFVLALG